MHLTARTTALLQHKGWNKTISRSYLLLYWTLVFLVVAMVAAVFGFTGIYVAAASIAKVLFFIFLVLFVISLVAGGLNRRPLV